VKLRNHYKKHTNKKLLKKRNKIKKGKTKCYYRNKGMKTNVK
jgi:hypothetical protein